MLEARRARRYPCYEGVDCEIGGRVLFAVLQDISLGGARLRGTGLPEVGTLIRLAPAFGDINRQWVYCQVCWVREGPVEEVGLRFMEPRMRLQNCWVAGMVPDQGGERRGSIRVPSELHVEVQVKGKRAVMETTTVDLSRDGAGLRLEQPLDPGQRLNVSLCLPWCCVDLPARVVRQLGNNQHSVRFLKVRPGDREALEGFVREELPAPELDTTSGMSMLRTLNGLH